ncbi:MAG: AarF/ABC1/UbiB kinase family protein [Myxococcales bacterium]|nr:AarF/ABC1/UbiB kinase family protein [Myxococcales bacterium]
MTRVAETQDGVSLKGSVKAVDGWLRGIERLAWGVREAVEVAEERRVALKRGLRGATAKAREEKQRLSSESERALKTGRTLMALVAGYRWHGIRSAWQSRARAADSLEALHQKHADAFVQTSLDHGGALLKVGQLLAARRDLLPRVWTEALETLCDQVPPAPEAAARQLLDESLSPEQSSRIHDIEWPPVAAASIGQVHRAIADVDDDGPRRVALKLQRPGIAQRVGFDLELLELVAEALASSLPPMDHDTIVAEIKATVLSELDYREEADAMHRVAERFAGRAGLRVPHVFEEFCSEQVLVSEWVDAKPLLVALDAAAEAGDRGRVSSVLELLLSTYVEQILVHGEFQADAHPGNFLVQADGTLVLIDFGCMRRLSPAMRLGFADIFAAALQGDSQRVAEQLAELGFRTQSGKPDTLLAFADMMLGDLRKALAGGDWPDLSDLQARGRALLTAATDDPVVAIPPEFVMIGRVFASLGGLFLHYRPDIDFGRAVMPHLATLALERAGAASHSA